MTSGTPVLFPSRRQLAHGAVLAAEAGSPVILLGKNGSGRTTFAHRVLRSRSLATAVLRLTGVQALHDVPFAALASVVAQLGTFTLRTDSPTALLASLAHSASQQHSTVLIDDANMIDLQSAAAFAQLAGSGVLSLVCATTTLATLPPPIRQLAVSSTAHRVELEEIKPEDAVVLLEDLLGGRVNVSAAGILLDHAGGNPLHLRELTFDAQSQGVLSIRKGFWTLAPQWRPRGERISELITARLSEQPDDLRQAVEILALTGELPLEFASLLLPQEVLDRAHDAGLVAHQPNVNRAPSVSLGSALTPASVISTVGRTAMRAHAARIRTTLPREEMHAHTRLTLALHSQDLDIVASPEELLQDASLACRARQFQSVLVLTRIVTEPSFATWSHAAARTELALIRAEALHETAHVEEALDLLNHLALQGSDQARKRSAWLEFSSHGDLPAALSRLALKDSAAPEMHAFARLLTLVGNGVVDLKALALDATNPEVSCDLRLRICSQLLVEKIYRGGPLSALSEISTLLESELWGQASPTAHGELLHAIHLAGITSSLSEPALAMVLGKLDWGNLAVDHATFIASQACVALENGDATTAADLTAQALALLDEHDPHNISGFIAVYDAVAATMLEDRERAAASYALFHSTPVTSGHLLRPDAERALLLVELFLHGEAAASAYYQRLLSAAQDRQRGMLVMLLHHDAWRYGLLVDSAVVSASAAGIEGTLAKTLSRYGQVLSEEPDSVGDLVEELVHAARPLFAAELANTAAGQARMADQRSRASILMSLSAELARPLNGVNTPALNRRRIIPGLLSEREYEVCVRAARGDSSATIAEELFLSTRTVEGHLQRAYAKLGVSDRRQLIPVA